MFIFDTLEVRNDCPRYSVLPRKSQYETDSKFGERDSPLTYSHVYFEISSSRVVQRYRATKRWIALEHAGLRREEMRHQHVSTRRARCVRACHLAVDSRNAASCNNTFADDDIFRKNPRELMRAIKCINLINI